MKKMLIAMVLMPLMALADTWTDPSSGITWNYVVDNGEAVVCNGRELSAIPATTKGAITIPSTLGGYAVTRIGPYAFFGCGWLTSVTFPNGIVVVDAYAFCNCKSLTSVTIPECVRRIGDYAYLDCKGLTSVAILSDETIIRDGAFLGCYGITSVTIPFNRRKISDVFYYENIQTVDILDGVTNIADHAFCNCRVLTSVEIPSSVKSIGYGAFDGCANLTAIEVAAGNDSYCSVDGVLCDRSVTKLVRCPEGKTGTTRILSTVTSVDENAFSGCRGLTSILVDEENDCYCSIEGVLYNKMLTDLLRCPEGKVGQASIVCGVTNLANGSFRDCRGLTDIIIPSSVTKVGAGAFSGCDGLTSVTMPACVEKLSSTFPDAYLKITNVIIEDGVTSIGWGAFYNCSGLTSVTIPSSVTNVRDQAFYKCGKLKSVEIPSGVTSIGGLAFADCSNLMSVTIPSGVTSFGGSVFSGCTGLTSVVIPDGVTSIEAGMLSGCSGLKSVTIPSGVTSIGNGAFSGCSGLTDVTIPERVTSIGKYAFEDCCGLTSIIVPTNVATIGIGAFSGCNSLISITLPFVGAHRGYSEKEETLFGYIFGISSIPDSAATVQDYSPWSYWYCNIPSSLKTVTITDTTWIGYGAFYNCAKLISVMIPARVTSIGGCAFYNCSGLTSVLMSEGLESIGDSAFCNCCSLESVLIPASVKRIDNYAFSNCSGLTSVVVPEGVTSIGGYAFSDCLGLKSVKILSSETEIEGEAFSGCTQLADPNGFLILNNVLCDYFGSEEFVLIPASVESIGNRAFADCRELKSVVIPSNVKNIRPLAFKSCSGLSTIEIPCEVISIGTSAFSGCSGLKSAVIHLGVRDVGDFAFCDCSALTSIVIPPSVTNLGSSVFSGCSGLTSITLPFVGGQRGNSNTKESLFGYVFGERWFAGATETKQYISEWTYSLASSVYYYIPTSLKSVSISDETVINFGAFFNCKSLTSVSIPLSVTDVGDKAFYGCSSLRRICVPDEVEIGENAMPSNIMIVRPISVCVGGRKCECCYDGQSRNYDVWLYSCDSRYDVGNITNSLPALSANVMSNRLELASEMFQNTNENYEVTFLVDPESNMCEVVILPRPVVVNTGSAQKVHDGTPLVCADIMVGGDGFVKGECVAKVIGSQTGVGSSKNTVCLEWAAGALESNYSIVTNEGTLTVLPAKVTKDGEEPGAGTKPVGGISKFDGEVVKYDGEGHTINVAALESVTLVADTPLFSYSLTSNGVYRSEPYYFTNACVTSFWYKISAANYEDYVHEARVTILPREVTPTSGSASKNFDGTALRCESVEVTGDRFVLGEGVDVVYTGSQLWPGSSENTFTYSFKQGTLGSNYDVTTANGTLTVGAAGRVVVDASVTVIPVEAFKNYAELTEVVLPDTVMEIGADAFAGCTKLTKVAFPSGMEVTREKLRGWGLSDAVLEDYVESDFVIVNTSLLGYVGAADVAELVIPDGIERIDEYALSELYDLERVEMPETVKYIGKGAFANDTYLDEVVLPDSVEVIGAGTFENCSWMQTMTMGAGVRSVGDRAFAGCTKLAAAKFADGLGEVGDAAFSNCWRMMSVSLPASVSNVAATAFTDCASLTGVRVPTGYGRAGARPSHAGTMADWFAPVYRQIENVMVPKGTTEVCSEMFAGCAALKTVELPEGVTNIASGAFRDCVALETILLPESLEAIGDEAFAGCAALKAIMLPKNVAVLGKRVFSGCAALSDVTLSRALTAIPDGIFAGCDALDSFVVPESVTELGSQIVSSATTAIYYLGNAPAYAADVYAQANVSLVSYVVEGTKGWDGRPMSRDIPRNWPTTNARAITTWPPVKIDVTFVGNGGAFENPADESCVCKQIVGTAYSLPQYEPVRKGYRFDGYWTEANGGTRVTSGVAVKLTKDHSLYAHWKECDTPTVEGDEGATVTGNAETGFVVKPSAEKTAVEVTIPQGVDAAKVTVEVSVKVMTVKPNGAKVKVVVGENDITGFLVIPESEGVLNIAAATVKEEIVKETLDPTKEAVLELNAANPQLITTPTRKGLTYTLYEGHRLESLSKGDSKLGDGNPWKPTIRVAGGDAAFYSIDVRK